MTLGDLYLDFVSHVMPLAVTLCVGIGAFVLWRRTQRASSLVQFIGSVFLFYGFAVNDLRWRSLAYTDFIRSGSMRISMDIAWLIGFWLFAIGYLLYALRQKRI